MKRALTLKHYGGLFVGQGAAEVLGDYGAGPNHTLPTGGTARSMGGLSVMTFLRVRTWMRVDDLPMAQGMVEDAAHLGDLEGLAGHAAAARARLPGCETASAISHGRPERLCSPTMQKAISTKASKKSSRLLFGVPKKGRMHDKCVKFLEAAGLEYQRPDRVDVAECTNLPITLVFLPAADIAQYVGEGNVDIGITGQDIVAETDVPVNMEQLLGFGKCKLALQVPLEHADTPIPSPIPSHPVPSNPIPPRPIPPRPIPPRPAPSHPAPPRPALQVPLEHADKPVSAYQGSRIVTSFPNIARKFFAPLDASAAALDGEDTKTDIKFVSGSVEAAIGLGLADAVVDLVETGTTMRAAGLTMSSTLMETQACLISNPHTKHHELVKKLSARIRGYIDSTKFQLINYNVSRANLPAALQITPGKKSPTILPLEDSDWVAVSAMAPKNQVPQIIDKLEEIGATDILVFTMSNCRV